MVLCPYCEKPINEDATQCPHCGAPVKLATVTNQPKTKTASQGVCPNCKSPVNKTDIICIFCGTNLLTGSKIVQEKPQERRIKFPSFEKKYLIYGLLVVLILVLVGAGIVYITYDPISSAISLSQTNPLGAIDILQKYIEKKPQNSRAHIILGKLHLKNNQLDEALLEFDKTIEIDNKNTDAIWLALYTATKKNNKEQQTKYLKKLSELYPERNDLKMLSLLGESNSSTTQNDEQLVSLATGLKSNMESIIALLISHGNYDAVLNLVNDENITPKTAVLLLMLTEIRNDDKNKQKYLSLLESNLQELSDAEKVFFACQILKSGDANRTLQILQTLKSRERLPNVFNYLYALSLLQSGLTTEAIVELEKIKNAEGNYSIDATLDLALIYYQQDNISKAMELIQAIKNKGQLTPRSYLVEGRIALANDDMNTAQQCFASAIQKDPNYAPAYLENGLLYIRRGVLSEGLKNLKTYIQIVKKVMPNYSTAEIEVLMEQIEQTLVSNPTTPQTTIATQ